MGGREPDEREAPSPEPLPDRVDFDPAYDPDAPVICDVCGAVMVYTGSCKIVCGNCGYVRDCEDP